MKVAFLLGLLVLCACGGGDRPDATSKMHDAAMVADDGDGGTIPMGSLLSPEDRDADAAAVAMGEDAGADASLAAADAAATDAAAVNTYSCTQDNQCSTSEMGKTACCDTYMNRNLCGVVAHDFGGNTYCDSAAAQEATKPDAGSGSCVGKNCAGGCCFNANTCGFYHVRIDASGSHGVCDPTAS